MDNQRLFLVAIFGFSLFMLWNAWQKHGQPVPAAAVTQSAPAGTANSASVPTPSAAATTTPPASATAAPTAGVVAMATIRTDLFTAQISANGGDIVRLELNQFRATGDQDRNFVLFDDSASQTYQAESGLIGAEGLANHHTVYQLAPGTYELKPDQDKLELRMTAQSDKGIASTLIYTFQRGSYEIQVTHEVHNGSAAAITPQAYYQLVRDDKAPEGTESSRMGASAYTGPAFYTEQGKYQTVDFADIAKDKAKVPGKAEDGWVAMVQQYFVSAWLPQGKVGREFFARKLDQLYYAGVKVAMDSVAPGQTGSITVPLYVGPQERDKLEKIAPGLELVVDYGWFKVFAAPIFWILEFLHRFVGNWGWAIILLTVMIKAAFFPLSAASYKSMAKMRQLTPKLTKLKETYADDKQRLNQEMMEMYKKEKVNPLGGCLPILIQIPVFIALYWVLAGTVEMRGAPWLGWITDLSAKDPYFIMPLIMGAT
ncbi:MAG TPA: membrane protein insertase YidC, partial [Rhodocyclaceae bacterium]|nr:membrane protein insertase YidC [Rhodocyclaceae bacterium]